MEEKCFLTCQLKVWPWGRPRQLAGCPFPTAGQPVLVRLWQRTTQCHCFWERVKETLPENRECSCLGGTAFAFFFFFFSEKKFYLQEPAC